VVELAALPLPLEVLELGAWVVVVVVVVVLVGAELAGGALVLVLVWRASSVVLWVGCSVGATFVELAAESFVELLLDGELAKLERFSPPKAALSSVPLVVCGACSCRPGADDKGELSCGLGWAAVAADSFNLNASLVGKVALDEDWLLAAVSVSFVGLTVVVIFVGLSVGELSSVELFAKPEFWPDGTSVLLACTPATWLAAVGNSPPGPKAPPLCCCCSSESPTLGVMSTEMVATCRLPFGAPELDTWAPIWVDGMASRSSWRWLADAPPAAALPPGSMGAAPNRVSCAPELSTCSPTARWPEVACPERSPDGATSAPSAE